MRMLAMTLAVMGLLGAFAWLVLHLSGAWALLRARGMDGHRNTGTGPSLTVVIAACNEADTLEAGVRSLLAQEYPGLKVVIVDDRSTDATGAVSDRIVASDGRVEVIHVTVLPTGWLGKVNALRAGFARATSEFVLFADADVVYREGALRVAMDAVVTENLDHLTVLPRLHGTSIWHRALMSAFFVGYLRRCVLSNAPFGYGAFNLVRKASFEATAGFDWLRMEVVDDIALGALMKRAGFRSACRVGTEWLEILWYPSTHAAIRGFEKNVFGALARYRVDLAVASLIGSVWLTTAPLLAFAGGVWLGLAALTVAIGALATQAYSANRRFGTPAAATMLEPLTHLMIAAALARGAWICLREGGIRWRGTFYPLDQLRAGRRVSFP